MKQKPFGFKNKQKKDMLSILNLEDEVLHSELKKKFNGFHAYLRDSGIDKLWMESWKQYNAGFYSRGAITKKNSKASGGGVLDVSANDYGSILRQLHSMVTRQSPSLTAVAMNPLSSSKKKAVDTKLLFEHYQKKGGMDEAIEKAKLLELIFGVSYLQIKWDSTIAESSTNTQNNVGHSFVGDLSFKSLNPFDVACNVAHTGEGGWYIVRELLFPSQLEALMKNSFEGEAEKQQRAKRKKEKYFSSKNIFKRHNTNYLGFSMGVSTGVSSISGFPNLSATISYNSELSDLIDVYTFYHSPTVTHPKGVCVIFTASALIYKGPMQGSMPIVRTMVEQIGNSAFGNSVAFDMLVLQKAKDKLLSTAITNEAAFSLSSIVVPKSAELDYSQLGKGINLFEVSDMSMKPEPLNLLSTSPEVFKSMDGLGASMERISGLNEVARGQSSPAQSGAALALMTSMATQSVSGSERSLRILYRKSGELMLSQLKNNLTMRRRYEIIGKLGERYGELIRGEDLASAYSVGVELVSPMRTTAAGREAIATSLLEKGLISDAREYLSVLMHGRIDGLLRNNSGISDALRVEAEKLKQGEWIDVIELQNHGEFIRSAQKLLNEKEVNENTTLVNRIYYLIERRMNVWRKASILQEEVFRVLKFPLFFEAVGISKEKLIESMADDGAYNGGNGGAFSKNKSSITNESSIGEPFEAAIGNTESAKFSEDYLKDYSEDTEKLKDFYKGNKDDKDYKNYEDGIVNSRKKIPPAENNGINLPIDPSTGERPLLTPNQV